MEMDTDSAYMALSGPIETIVRPQLRQDFWNDYGDWFPRPYCSDHKEAFITTQMSTYSGGKKWTPSSCCEAVLKHDAREPGLFKCEFRGVGMVCLNSKTYYCWDDKDEHKYSTKGLSKRTNSFHKENFLDVLNSGKSMCGINKGFVVQRGTMSTYEQSRRGLTALYAKRVVQEDGVSTRNLDI